MRFHQMFVVAIALASIVPQCVRAQATEQTTFSAEDAGVKKPVALPADVLFALKNDSFAADAFREDVPSSCFSASAIRLGPREDDLIVEAEGKLRGANVNMFWVFLTTPEGHRLVLKEPAHTLVVENPRTHDYRDITLSYATTGTMTTEYLRFNGKKYALHHQRTEAVR